MSRETAQTDVRITGTRPLQAFVGAVRAFAVLVFASLALLVAADAAHAQAVIHNGNVPLNTPQNGSATASGTLLNRGSDSNTNTVPYNNAQFDFIYSITGGTWNGGVQYQVQGGKQMIWVQPTNVPLNANRFATYTIDLTRGVEGLTFRIGGLDFQDAFRIQFLYQGALRTINPTWVSALGPNGGNVITVTQLSTTQLEVASINTDGGSADTSLNFVQFTVPAGVLVDEVRIVSGKNAGFTSNNTIGFHDFNWLPIPIDAVNDSATGINGNLGQANVYNVLTNDTFNDPNTAAVDPATLTNVTLTQVSTTNAGVTLNPSTGILSVAAGTPAGTYTVTYRICARNTVPANCDTATATVTVVTPTADLSIAKTNGVTQVRSGDTVTYTLTVRNNGPSAVTGARVTDTPGAGLTCPAGNAVTIAGSGVPAGSFTISNLTGGGIALGTLSSGQSTTLTFSCQVN